MTYSKTFNVTNIRLSKVYLKRVGRHMRQYPKADYANLQVGMRSLRLLIWIQTIKHFSLKCSDESFYEKEKANMGLWINAAS